MPQPPPSKPRHPFGNDPGYHRARECLAPCGGWIVMYDHGPDAGDDRYVVAHSPSGSKRACPSRGKAEKLYKNLAEGIDRLGMLPQNPILPITPVDVLPASEAAPVTGGDSHARAGDNPLPGTTASPPPNYPLPPPTGATHQTPAKPLSDPRALDLLNLQLLQHLEAKFPFENLMIELESGLAAVKAFQQDGDIVSIPDHATRVKYLDLILKYKIGTPYQRAEVKDKGRMDLGAFISQLHTNPAYRAQFRNLLDEADAKASSPP